MVGLRCCAWGTADDVKVTMAGYAARGFVANAPDGRLPVVCVVVTEYVCRCEATYPVVGSGDIPSPVR